MSDNAVEVLMVMIVVTTLIGLLVALFGLDIVALVKCIDFGAVASFCSKVAGIVCFAIAFRKWRKKFD